MFFSPEGDVAFWLRYFAGIKCRFCEPSTLLDQQRASLFAKERDVIVASFVADRLLGCRAGEGLLVSQSPYDPAGATGSTVANAGNSAQRFVISCLSCETIAPGLAIQTLSQWGRM